MMRHEHNHFNENTKEKSLITALILTLIVLVVEVIGGYLTESLALISDAAHMLTDTAALAIALFAIKIGKQPADMIRTFGYFRFEILAAAFNAILLFFVAIYILYEAYQRLNHPPEIYSMGMLMVAILGLCVNLVSIKLLSFGTESSLNLKSAYLEVWSDALSSLGVIIGSLLIYTTGWVWIDSLIAILIGLWVLPRTWILIKECINVLLEGVPAHIDLNQLRSAMLGIDGVLDLHELHVWSITSDKISLTAHVVLDAKMNSHEVLSAVRQVLFERYHISHTTLQQEDKTCLDSKLDCHFHR